MCAILDANVRDEVFGSNPSEAGLAFLDWLMSEGNALVIGGKLSEELENGAREKFLDWLNERLSGRIVRFNDEEIRVQEAKLTRSRSCVSDDEHIIALLRSAVLACCIQRTNV